MMSTRQRVRVIVLLAGLLLVVFLSSNLLAVQENTSKPSKAEVIQKTQKLHMPFIANEGQVDERVAFYAKTFGGTVFVTKDGDIVYSLPSKNTEPCRDESQCSPMKDSLGWHGQAELVRAESEFAGVCYLPLLYADNANCSLNRIFRKSPLTTLLPNSQKYTDKQSLSMPPNSNPSVFSTNYNANIKPVIARDVVPKQSRKEILRFAQNDNVGKEPLNNPHSEVQNPESISSISPNPKSEIQNPKLTGVALREEFIGAKVSVIKGEGESITKVSYFKGNDPSKWKSNISTYELVNLGEIYDGIELKLKAHGNNVEKLLYVKPGADTNQIKISLSGLQPSENPPPLSPSVRGTGGCPPLAGAGGGLEAECGLGARGLWVNEEGQLEAATALGTVKFTKPIAYQEIDGKRVEVDVAYQIETCKAQNTEYVITHPLPLSRGECLRAGSGLQPEPLNLLNTGVCAVDTISKGINTGVQVANLNPQEISPLLRGAGGVVQPTR